MYLGEKKCRGCIFATFYDSETPLACTFICKRNPFRPVIMGFKGRCSERKRNMKEQAKQRKEKKKQNRNKN